MREGCSHRFANIVIAGHAIDGQAQWRKQVAKMLIGASGVILNQIAGHDDNVGLPVAIDVIGKHGAKRRMGHCAAEAALCVGEQMRVCQVQYPERISGIVNKPGPCAISITCANFA